NARFSAYLNKNSKTVMVAKKEDKDSPAPGDANGGKKRKGAKADKEAPKKAPKDPAELPAYWRALAALYAEDAKKIQKQAQEDQDASEHYHHRAARLDLGHLGLELSLVLSAIALLAREKNFWFAGMAVGLLGAGVSFSAFLL